jgi:ribosomal protein L37E
MLVTCPDCDRQVSDRANACPGCGFPVAEHMREKAIADAKVADRSSRARAGEVDCVRCDARGFCSVKTDDGEHYQWCSTCEHTGRVELCRSDRGWFAVTRRSVDAFVAGERDDDGEHVVFLGVEAPAGHRYEAAGKRVLDDE